MRNKCRCKLPYVKSGTITCTICGNYQERFFSIEEQPLSVKREFKGVEFRKGDVVEVIGNSYACLVEIMNYIPDGWYRVKLPNGGYKETQILGDIVLPHSG